jgi:Flp pilus assembly protein CpaB
MEKKRLLVSILVSLGVVGALFIGNQINIQKQVQPTPVPVAAVDIPPHTEITQDMVKIMELPAKAIPPEAMRTMQDVVGKWTQVDFGVPKNSLFYQGKVVTQEELLDAERLKLKDGERLYTLTVDVEKSAAGNIIPGVLVDVWYLGKGNDNKQLAGRLFQDVLVVGAKNRKAESIVTTNASTGEEQQKTEKYPTIVQLAVTDEMIPYLDLARSMGQIKLIPKSGAIVTVEDDSRPETQPVHDRFDVKAYLDGLSIVPGMQENATKNEGGNDNEQSE